MCDGWIPGMKWKSDRGWSLSVHLCAMESQLLTLKITKKTTLAVM
jgi:hypothetical protein